MRRLFRDAVGRRIAAGGSVVGIGAFDGVHRGHQAVLAAVRERAAALGVEPIAVTFEPIPREFFATGARPPRLTTAREKVVLLEQAGLRRVLLLRFDAALAAMSAQDFVARVLIGQLGVREVWVGDGFRFGHRRAGDVALLRELGARDGFEVRTQAPVLEGGERISSSRIRARLAADDFAGAAALLGRPFAMGGRVVRGQQLGRTLGYPTANLRLGRRVAPVGGIFAVRVHGIGAIARPGVASLGMRPTVDGREPLLEAHLFDFDGDLYGKRIEVEFVEKLRDEEKFPDLDALVRQMDRDAAQARAVLGMPAAVNARATT